jgi:maltooligosyltrehalose trehalohydrolase
MHVDGLRLDAVHAIVDPTASPFIRELAESVRAEAAGQGRVVHVIAEDASNDPRVTAPADRNGLACDGQWNDDFHHALRAALTGDRRGYFSNFGEPRHVARAYASAFVLTGQPSSFHRRRHGAPPTGAPDSSFVVFAQNHDQVGNRLRGERLGENVSFEALKLAAAATLLSPYAPMLFMGEEFAASARFPYFVSHTDEALVEAVRKGRAEEFAAFDWEGEPPDPQSEDTFASAKLDWDETKRGEHATMLSLYRELLELRRRFNLGGLDDRAERDVWCDESSKVVVVRRRIGDGALALALNVSEEPARAPLGGDWAVELDTAEARWGGPSDAPESTTLAAWSAKLLAQAEEIDDPGRER